jgi:hypothetical protein
MDHGSLQKASDVTYNHFRASIEAIEGRCQRSITLYRNYVMRDQGDPV